MTTNYVDINDKGHSLAFTQFKLQERMGVNGIRAWAIRAKSRRTLIDGLASEPVAGYKFCRPTDSVVKTDSRIHAFLARWELPSKMSRNPVMGIGHIPFFGIAKRIADHFQHRWVIYLTCAPKQMAQSGWTLIDDGRWLSKKSADTLSCNDLSGLIKRHFERAPGDIQLDNELWSQARHTAAYS